MSSSPGTQSPERERQTRDRGWNEHGFYRIDGFAGPATGHDMLDAAIAIVRGEGDTGSGPEAVMLPEANLALTSADAPEDRMSKVFRLHRRAPFSDFIRRADVGSLLVERIGPDIDCFLSQLIFKNPGAWGQPWHQDSFYFPFRPMRPVIGLWLAISEATLENGCLHVLPGSHLEPVHEHVPDRRPNANIGYVEVVDHDMDAAEPVLMSAGDLLVFDSHLMHRSTDNVSEGRRVAMVFHFAAAGTEDLTEEVRGHPSPVNDWTPVVRGGHPVPEEVADGR